MVPPVADNMDQTLQVHVRTNRTVDNVTNKTSEAGIIFIHVIEVIQVCSPDF